jgi:hypothetical protein
MARRTVNAKWQMHESSQRALCRAAFVFFGVAPLLLVIAFSIVQFIPAYQEHRASSWSIWLSGRLGVDVQVAAVESLAPERYVLHGLRLSHPESRASLGRIRSVEVSRRAAVWSILLDQPEFETRQLSATWRMIHDWFVCRPQSAQPAVRITCAELKIRELDQEQALEQIAVEIYSQADRTIVGGEFRMAGAEPNSKSSQLRIVRQHSDRHLSTILDLESGPTGLPCNLIAPVFPFAQKLGERAIFLGKLSLYQRNNAWQVNLTNSWLAGVNYSRIHTGIDSHVTDGNLVWFENLKVTDRGLQNARGGIKVVHGRIDGALLTATQQTLGVKLPRAIQTVGVAQSFEQLEALFEISPGVFQLTGCLENTLPDASGVSRPLAPGTLIADAAGEIAIRANYDEPMSMQSLVSALEYNRGVTTASNPSPDNSPLWLTPQSLWWLPLEKPQSLTQADANSAPLQ